jgi:hypothetical protein
LTDDDFALLRDILLPALESEHADTGVEARAVAERRLALLHDLTDAELDDKDQEQVLAGWIARALSD